MDPTVTVALISFLGLIVTSASGILVASITTRNKQRAVAEKTATKIEDRLERLHEKEIAFKDARIHELENDNRNLEEKNEELEAENVALRLQLGWKQETKEAQ